MTDLLRIPPAVNLSFERLANQICEQAKLDYDTWHLHSHELVTHLQARWREGIEKGLSTDAAEERALTLFGKPSDVAKALRKPWLTRLLNYKRFRTERLLVFLAAYVFYAWMQVLDVHYRHHMDGAQIDVDKIMLPFTPQFFTEGMGVFFVGIATVLAVVAIQWKPIYTNQKLNQFLQIRYALLALVAFSLFELSVKPCALTLETFQKYESYLFYQGYCVLHILGVIFGWLGVACLAVELFGKPSHFRNQKLEAGPLKAT